MNEHAMAASTAHEPDTADPGQKMYGSQTGGRRHLRQCPHLVDVDPVLEAASDDTRDICQWCLRELDGVGRTYHLTLEAALADLGAAQHARPELTRLLNEVTWDQVFVPNSRSYVTVLKGDRPAAWAGKTYVDYPDRPMVTLPDFVGRDGDGGRQTEGVWGQTCPDCNEQRSLSGACAC